MTMSYDELLEIFSCLPAKAIYKFMCVDNMCSHFSKETYFAMKQTQNALLKNDSCFFIQPDITQRYIKGITEFHSLPGEDLSSGVSSHVVQFLANNDIKIMSTTNGLILGRAANWKNVDDLFIINPATQCWLPIPAPNHIEIVDSPKLDIVFECDSDNFMVFLFYDNSEWPALYRGCQVYMAKEGVWKDRETRFFNGPRELKFDSPVLYNGAIHFISDCGSYLNNASPLSSPYIVSYTLESGDSRVLRVPKEAKRGSHDTSCEMKIFKWGKVASRNQSICLVRLRKSVFTVWVLFDYESWWWKRIVKVRVKTMKLMEQDPIVINGFTVLNGELLVFATNKKVYGYDLVSKNCMRSAREICEHGCESKVCIISYSNTLRICGVDARPLPLHATPLQEQP